VPTLARIGGEAAEKWLGVLLTKICGCMISRLQSNKADEAVRLFDVILARPAIAASGGEGEQLSAQSLYQVNIGAEARGRWRSTTSRLSRLVRASHTVRRTDGHRRVRGLTSHFWPSWRGVMASKVSAWAVGRLSTAVMLGATAVRVGSALFED
jgi:uncharacterized pyridoxal phosphate-containing UPF0001 family protein